MRMHLLSIVAACFLLGRPANAVVQATASMSQTRSVSLLSHRQDPVAATLITAADAHAGAAKALKEAADALRDTASNLKVAMGQMADAKNLPDEDKLEMAVKTHFDEYNEELDRLRVAHSKTVPLDRTGLDWAAKTVPLDRTGLDWAAKTGLDWDETKVSKTVQDAKNSANGQLVGEQATMAVSGDNVQVVLSKAAATSSERAQHKHVAWTAANVAAQEAKEAWEAAAAAAKRTAQAKVAADEVAKAEEAHAAASAQADGAAGGAAKAAVKATNSQQQAFAWEPIDSSSTSVSTQGSLAPVQFLGSFAPLRIRSPP